MRGLTTGAVHVGLLGHLGYFLVMIVGGWWWPAGGSTSCS